MSVLSGIKIIEIEGIGPAPFCGMHLADMGADVVVIERPGPPGFGDIGDAAITKRGKRIIKMDLKNADDIASLKDLIANADGLIEGMRPGVMERLGLGPDVCSALNPSLVYGRVTGWGQDGPLAHAAGHDINYIALSGALYYSGRPGDAPVAPPTMIGDVAGGALYLTIGMLAGLLQAKTSGKGDVIDAAMVDGSAHMMNLLMSASVLGGVREERGTGLFDGSHWFDTYECKDGRHISLGSLEPKFYKLLLESLELENDPAFKVHINPKDWPAQKAKFTEIFRAKTRDEWCAQMEGTDICFAPVLSPFEAAEHPHMKARGVYQSFEGRPEIAPAPRFASAPKTVRKKASGDSLENILKRWSGDE